MAEWETKRIQETLIREPYRAFVNYEAVGVSWHVMRPERKGQPDAPVLSGRHPDREKAQRCCEILIEALREIDALGGTPGWRD